VIFIFAPPEANETIARVIANAPATITFDMIRPRIEIALNR
jgi:hypothetical protein